MGCIASCVAGCAGSCCGSLCGQCNSAKSSNTTRAPYLFIMLLCSVLALILRYFGGPLFVHIYWIHFQVCGGECMGFAAVYRISFVLFCFFAFHALFMLSEGTAKFHSTGWVWKIILLIVFGVVSFLVPNEFFDIYSAIARFVSILFLVLQVMVLIDFSYRVQESLPDDDNRWKAAYVFATLAMFTGSIVICVYCFRWFTQGDCKLNTFFVVFTLLWAIIFSVLSMISERGMLPPSMVAIYCFYLLYSALSSDPGSCNSLANDETTAQTVIGIILAVVSVCYSGYSVSSGAFFDSDDGGNAEAKPLPLASGDDSEAQNKSDKDNTEVEVIMTEDDRSSNRRFHFIMAVSSMYMAMVLTNWVSNEDSSATSYNLSTVTLWVKITSLWLTTALYIWTLIAPKLFPDREFDF